MALFNYAVGSSDYNNACLGTEANHEKSQDSRRPEYEAGVVRVQPRLSVLVEMNTRLHRAVLSTTSFRLLNASGVVMEITPLS
jgi:hypothetical protein